MDKKITIWCIGVLITLFAFPVESIYSQVMKPMRDNVLYYLKIDTAGVDVGYLRMDSAGVKLKVDQVKGDYAMWYIKHVRSNIYAFVNKTTNETDTLRFNPPVILEDTVASKVAGGALRWWDDLTFNEDSRNEFIAPFEVGHLTYNRYNLTMGSDGIVMLSSDTSSLHNRKLRFFVERVAVLPDESKYYRLAVDTVGIPDISSACNFLYTDTMVRRDSIAVSDTVSGDLGLWKFVVDTIIYDTAYFKIYNKVTDSILSFVIPENDTVAYTNKTGSLNRWKIPFFIEENGTGKILARDTLNNKKYYLGLKGNSVMLTTDTVRNKCLKFALLGESIKPHVPDSSIVDSTKIYKVKYLSGPDSGKYLGTNVLGTRVLLDTVCAHIPDGQFVVFTDNKYSLMNRAGNIKTDSLFLVCDTVTLDTIPNWYTNRVDTFEIVPITYGNINTHKSKTRLGYKYMMPEELSLYSYVFSYTSTDSLNGFVLGYNETDSLAILLASGDTVKFLLESQATLSTGAPTIAGIPQLQKDAYYLRSFDNDSLCASIKSGKLAMNKSPNINSFFLKEDLVEGKYYFVENLASIRKVLVDSTRHAYLAPIDSVVTHHFAIAQKDRRSPEEPDGYDYLTTFPNSKGKGFYELRIVDPLTLENKWLTKNFDDYAVLGKEGESMLRAGSFTPHDLHLWVDTARGTGFNPLKPSFYIVKDVDTADVNFNGYNISGYFMHVMDSTSIALHSDYVYYDTDSSEFNRANFVRATRYSANELLLASGASAQLRDSVGFAGKNEDAINEYRFYLQKTGNAADINEYYIVTEAGYGDGGRTFARGYLSISNNVIYFGPREKAVKVSFSSSTVSNEIVKPPFIEEVNNDIAIIGGVGQVTIRNAMGQEVVIFNILGQSVVKKVLSSDNEAIPVSRGIMIVKTGVKTQKVVVK